MFQRQADWTQDLASTARGAKVAPALLATATLLYASVPALNYFAHGSEYPMLITGISRLAFALGLVAFLAIAYRPLLSRKGFAVMRTVFKEHWRMLLLSMLTTGDVALFSLSYRFVDISIAVVLASMAPAANVIILHLINRSWISWKVVAGLVIATLGMIVVVIWAQGSSIGTNEQWSHLMLGVAAGIGVAVCGGLVVSALRMGEALAVEWYWAGLGSGAGLVSCASLLTLALTQGVTAPIFLLLDWSALTDAIQGDLPWTVLPVMFAMGFTVLLGTGFWALANGSGLRPLINGMGYLQPGFALLILVLLGVAGTVNWIALMLGLTLIVGSNIAMQLWDSRSA